MQNLIQDVSSKKEQPPSLWAGADDETVDLEQRVDQFTSQYLPDLIGDKNKKRASEALASLSKDIQEEKAVYPDIGF